MKYALIPGEANAVVWADEQDGNSGVIREGEPEWDAYVSWLQAGNSPAASIMVFHSPSIDDLRMSAIRRVNDEADSALKQLVQDYPDRETATWSQQLGEATAYRTDPSAPTPMLSAIAAACGRSVPELAATVLLKASAFQAASGAIVGKRLVLASKLEAAKTPEEIAAVTGQPMFARLFQQP